MLAIEESTYEPTNLTLVPEPDLRPIDDVIETVNSILGYSIDDPLYSQPNPSAVEDLMAAMQAIIGYALHDPGDDWAGSLDESLADFGAGRVVFHADAQALFEHLDNNDE